MKNATAFLLFNIVLILSNVVGAGILMVAAATLGDLDSVLVWLLVGVVAIVCSIVFWRGAIESLRDLVVKLG